MELAKGANAPITAGEVRIAVVAATPIDVAALLLTTAGKVRSDDDFVFYNQPTAPGVRVHPPDAIQVVTGAVPAEIDKIVITASLDGAGPVNWGQAGALRVAVTDAASGAIVATFVPTGLGPETALIACEIYRRQGAWKVRAVGQGYAEGLEGIATDFGISVDEPAAVPVPEAVVAAPAFATPAPAAAPPPSPAAPPPAPVPAPAVRFGQPTVSLDKGRVSLRKNETVALVKQGAPPLSRVRMGLGWDPAVRGRNVDLDASVIAYDSGAAKLVNVWFMKQLAFDGVIRHSGDNLTGRGEGDDEVISVDLTALPPTVYALLFTVNSFAGHKFDQVGRAHCRLVDDHSGAELVRFELSKGESTTGVFMCVLTRGPHGWNMTALGEYAKGSTVRKMVEPGKRFVLATL